MAMAGKRGEAMTQFDADIIDADDFELALKGEFGSGANYKVEIYRVTGESGSRGAFVGNHPTDQIDGIKERCLEEFGTGTYRIAIRKEGRYIKDFRFAVEKVASPGRTMHTPAPAHGDSSVIERLLTHMAEQERRLVALIDARTNAPASDPYEQMSKMATVMAQLRGNTTETTAGATANAFIDAVNKGIALGKELGAVNGAAPSTGLLDIINSLAQNPVVGDALKMILERAAAGGAPAPVPAGQMVRVNGARPPAPPAGALPHTPAPAGPVDHAKALDTELRQKIAWLIEKAVNGANPELYAELLLDDLTPALSQMIIKTPNILDQLAIAIPEIAPHRAWFDLVVAAMIRFDQESGESDLTADAVGGSAVGTAANTGR